MRSKYLWLLALGAMTASAIVLDKDDKVFNAVLAEKRVKKVPKHNIKPHKNNFKDLTGNFHQCKLTLYRIMLKFNSVVSTINIDLINNYEIAYTAYLYLGGNKTQAELVYDTGSGWLTVATNECLSCSK